MTSMLDYSVRHDHAPALTSVTERASCLRVPSHRASALLPFRLPRRCACGEVGCSVPSGYLSKMRGHYRPENERIGPDDDEQLADENRTC